MTKFEKDLLKIRAYCIENNLENFAFEVHHDNMFVYHAGSHVIFELCLICDNEKFKTESIFDILEDKTLTYLDISKFVYGIKQGETLTANYLNQ